VSAAARVGAAPRGLPHAASRLRLAPLCTAAKGSDSARILNSQIAGASGARELLLLHELFSSMYDSTHLSTTWNRLGRASSLGSESSQERQLLLRDDGAPLEALRVQTLQSLPRFEPSTLCDVARVVSQLAPQGAAWDELWVALEATLERCAGHSELYANMLTSILPLRRRDAEVG